MQRFVRRISTLDPAYFTGNPQYYQSLLAANQYLTAHGLNAKLPSTMTGPWMTMNQMSLILHMRLREESYNDLVHRLNLLYAIKDDKKLNEFLLKFVKVGVSLEKKPKPEAKLDEFGRSYTVASRKTAKAEAWIVPGAGHIYINGIIMPEYFKRIDTRATIVKPFEIANCLAEYNVWAKCEESGQVAQAEAISVAVARGIAVHKPEMAEILGNEGLLKIDTRQVEKKKTNQPKARKKVQWVKR